MGRKEDADIDARLVHVLQPRLHVPADLGTNGRQRRAAAGREGEAAARHVRAPRQAERVAHAERPAGLDRFDDRSAAAEQRVALALLFLQGDGLAQPLIGSAVGGIDIVLVELIGALADMGIHIDDALAVPAHCILLTAGVSGRSGRRGRGGGRRGRGPVHCAAAGSAPRRRSAASALAKSASVKPYRRAPPARIWPPISRVMLGLLSTRFDTSGKLESKCGKSLDTHSRSAPPSNCTTAPTSRSPLSIAEKQLRCQYSNGDSFR